MKRARLIAALALTALGVALLYGLAQAVADPIQRQADLAVPGIAPGTAPYRVALLSDIHFGNHAMGPARLERIVAQVNAAKPDLIVIVGDFVNGNDGLLETDPRAMAAPLAALRAPGGVVAVLGNHDHWTDAGAVRAALAGAGITVLSNQAEPRGPLLLVGIDDVISGHADVAAAMAHARGRSGALVALSHSPDIARELPGEISLVLAGHTHCGQIVLPLIGAIGPLLGGHFYYPQYECGLVREIGRTEVVTGGLGAGSVPLRIGAPSDWWLLTLRAS